MTTLHFRGVRGKRPTQHCVRGIGPFYKRIILGESGSRSVLRHLHGVCFQYRFFEDIMEALWGTFSV